MSRIITPFNAQREVDKYDLSAIAGRKEVDMIYQQQREDIRLHEEYSNNQIDAIKQISEARHQAVKDVMDLVKEEVWKPRVEKEKVYYKKDYDKFIKSLDNLQRISPLTLEEFVFINLYPDFLYETGYIAPLKPTQGYKIYHEHTARYLNNHEQLQKDFEKEYL